MKNKILNKIEEFGLRFDQVDKRFDAHDQRLDEHDKRFDLLVEKLLNHDGRLEYIEQNMATKEDIHGINNTLDA